MTDSLPMQDEGLVEAARDLARAIRDRVTQGPSWRESELIAIALEHLTALSTRPAPASPPGLVEDLRRLPSFYDNDRQQYLGITLEQHASILAALSPDARVLPIEGELAAEFAELVTFGGEVGSTLVPAEMAKRILAALSTPATDEWQQAIEAAAKVVRARIERRKDTLTSTTFDPDRDWDDGIHELEQVEQGIAALKVHPLQGEGDACA